MPESRCAAQSSPPATHSPGRKLERERERLISLIGQEFGRWTFDGHFLLVPIEGSFFPPSSGHVNVSIY